MFKNELDFYKPICNAETIDLDELAKYFEEEDKKNMTKWQKIIQKIKNLFRKEKK